MKKIIKHLIIILSLYFVSYSSDVYSISPWDNFINQPSSNGLILLRNTVGKNKEHCSREEMPSTNQDMQIFDQIKKGNQFSFSAGLLIASCLDGGELEDFHRSSGLFFEQHPQIFLQKVQEVNLSDGQLKSMLVMLPLETVDNIDLRLSKIDNRISALKLIDEKSLQSIMNKGLSFLVIERDSLSKIKQNLATQK